MLQQHQRSIKAAMPRKRKPRIGHDSLSGIAEVYNVSHQTAWNWSRKEGFPSPSGYVSSVPVYNLEEVKRFVDNHVDHSKRPKRYRA